MRIVEPIMQRAPEFACRSYECTRPETRLETILKKTVIPLQDTKIFGHKSGFFETMSEHLGAGINIHLEIDDSASWFQHPVHFVRDLFINRLRYQPAVSQNSATPDHVD